MRETLDTIGVYTWFVDFIAMVILLVFAWKDRRTSSSLIALATSVIAGGLMNQYTPYVLQSNNPASQNTILFVWYLGFVAIDAAAMAVIYKCHLAFVVRYNFITKMVLLSIFIKAQLHLIRYGERIIWDTHYIKPLYTSGISGINIATAATAMLFVLAITISRIRVAKGKRGLTWLI